MTIEMQLNRLQLDVAIGKGLKHAERPKLLKWQSVSSCVGTAGADPGGPETFREVKMGT